MIIILGAIIVLGSVLGGFVWAGGNIGNLLHPSEFLVIGGSAVGAAVIMAPKKVLFDIVHSVVSAFKGVPFARKDYDELFKALYELFLLGRRNGMVALEEHVLSPKTSTILQKYPGFLKNHEAVEFLCSGLRPVIDGRIKPDQLRHLLEVELERMEVEEEAPVNVLTKVADAMPGFGIVAAVLGIVITMHAISGPIEQIGEKVAAALVGTFLGIFIAYGFMNPLATNIEFVNAARMAYFRCIAESVSGFASGLAPIMVVELARRSLSRNLCPAADELEAMLKGVGAAPKK